eukprot:TRINITY_DN6091_c0_g1_i1.p1 TRINITY_DN6091_c0_g1~~TRINITY_DN6091_c0_g1_i1.p1  ORF type:complete len:264 (-),score=40.36 TRINITY_DN6091_c0_g1_i1:48-839(-)
MFDNTTFPPSLTDMSYTYAFSRWICIDWMYPLHILTAYFVVFMGVLSFVSRLIPQVMFLHVWFGRLYMIVMYWSISSSILIHTAGMSMSIIISFAILLSSLTLGWIAIKVWNIFNEREVMREAERLINSQDKRNEINLEEIYDEARANHFQKKTYWERVFSFKTLHGALMAIGWWQLAGRAMVTDPFTGFDGCYTYPAVYENGTLQLLPEENPGGSAFVKNPTVFTTSVMTPVLILVVLITLVGNFVSIKLEKCTQKEKSGDL